MSQSPEMLSGMRGPRSVRMDAMQAAELAAKALPEAIQSDPEVTVYIATARRYRVQITSPADIVDPYTGRKQIGKPVVAQFEDGVYRNDVKDRSLRKMIDQALQSNRYFGKFGAGGIHFWLASDQAQAAATRKIKAAVETLKSLPKEAVDEFVRSLRQGDKADHDVTGAHEA